MAAGRERDRARTRRRRLSLGRRPASRHPRRLRPRRSLGQGASGRRVGLTELIGLRADTPPELELGGSARATFAVLDLAARSVTEGLLHPQLQHGGRTWLAYWGATIDEPIQAALDAIAAALPEVCADAFDGDRDALVHDLYACAVDQIARDRLRTAGVRLGNRLMRNRPSAPELFLDGLTSTEPELPPHAGLGALERRLTDWVDRGLERRSSAPWLLSLRLDERSDDEDNADRVLLRRARALAAGSRRSDARPPHVTAP